MILAVRIMGYVSFHVLAPFHAVRSPENISTEMLHLSFFLIILLISVSAMTCNTFHYNRFARNVLTVVWCHILYRRVLHMVQLLATKVNFCIVIISSTSNKLSVEEPVRHQNSHIYSRSRLS